MLSISATDVAFVMAAIIQAMAALLWALGVRVLGDIRHAAAHWSGYAALSAVSFLFLVWALHLSGDRQAEYLRAVGNVASIGGVLVLQRGIWLFVGRPTDDRLQLGVLALAVVIACVGLDAAHSSLRIGANSTVLTCLSLAIGLDLTRHARDSLEARRPWLMALPLWLSMAGFMWRGGRALFFPPSVSMEMTADSSLNVASAFAYVVIVLALHATLTALVINQLVGELRRRSRHDALTGLLNRRTIEEYLAAQVRTSARTGESFVVMMLDLDHFKSINDGHGHPVGDLALRHVSSLLRGGLREIDHLARYGGEEFLALLPGVALAGATILAERLRVMLSESPLINGAVAIPVSASIGLAQWDGASDEVERILVRADAALLLAKQRGRNRVVAAAYDDVPSGPR